MFDEHVELLKRAFVEEEVDALARRQLAALVLGVDARLAAAEAGDAAAPFQFLENFLHAISLAAAGGNPAVRLCARP